MKFLEDEARERFSCADELFHEKFGRNFTNPESLEYPQLSGEDSRTSRRFCSSGNTKKLEFISNEALAISKSNSELKVAIGDLMHSMNTDFSTIHSLIKNISFITEKQNIKHSEDTLSVKVGV